MKIISVLSICSLLCACGIENIDQPHVCCSDDYMRPGVNFKDVEATLDKCGQQKLISMQHGPSNVYMNQLFKMEFCMEDHGFFISDSSARQGCRNNLPDRYPVCEARGAYK
ncbi:hypothetical protein [uncultured Bartonella sp.]|uniref:hypothetical protein n=1 Tax=uncultured Bartonella sp. TaxID=104108 RepID=UPI0025E56BFF|nr:hypothetical protein [uncultured Bartonella sp.]